MNETLERIKGMTREGIEAIPPGAGLDELIGRAIGVTPVVQWQALDAEDHGSYYGNEDRYKVEEFLREQHQHGRLLDVHLGKWEFWPRFSTKMEEAARMFCHTEWYQVCHRPTGAVANFTGDPRWEALVSYDEVKEALGVFFSTVYHPYDLRKACQALAICRAWMLAVPFIDEAYLTGEHEREILKFYAIEEEDGDE